MESYNLVKRIFRLSYILVAFLDKARLDAVWASCSIKVGITLGKREFDFPFQVVNPIVILLNKVFDLSLTNANTTQSNVAAIDLVDKVNKVVFQVSSRNDLSKVRSSLEKIDTSIYSGFNFKYLAISKSAANLRDGKYNIPQEITFNPLNDIHDVDSLAAIIKNIPDIDKIEDIGKFLQKELVEKFFIRPNIVTEIINRLANQTSNNDLPQTPLPFDISEKIIHNGLDNWGIDIAELAIYTSKVSEIYATFASEGNSKSNAVLFSLRHDYLNLKDSYTGDELFDKLLEKVYEDADGDTCCNESITKEELKFNISIILVDAFMRCKIFERPN